MPRYKNAVGDPAGDTFGSGPVQIDLGGLSAEVVADDLVITLGFLGSISSPDSGRSDALAGYLDLDLDQDGTTGDVPWTDLLRGDAGETGMGNEAYIDFLSYDVDGNVELIDDGTEQVLGLVSLAIGDQQARVHIPLALIGGDRSVDVAVIAGTLEEATDAAPNQGSVSSSEADSGVLLQGDRFRVQVQWGDAVGNDGLGRLAERSEDSAIFFFFAPANWETLVKVLDGCGVNDHFWVFISGATTVEYLVTVTDTASGQQKAYGNPLGQVAQTVTDATAFATCP